jgi:endonuclease YncB( thermonuclease family)
VVPTGDMIDTNGRLLAYVAPWYANTQTDPLPPRNDPRRNTLNLDMIANGWAAFFPIYPSLPSNQDLNRTINAADSAWRSKKGAWEKYGENLLLGYEFRMCVKLSEARDTQEGIDQAFQRICIDLRNLSIVGAIDYGCGKKIRKRQ